MVAIKPGMTADIVSESDEPTKEGPPLQSVIYEVTDRSLILSQTTPPITDVQQGKRLLVTFLDKSEEANPTSRYGIWATLTRLMTNYEIAPSQMVPALVLERETKPQTHNFRMSYRINPATDSDLTVLVRGVRVNVIDISIGGVRIGSKSDLSLKANDIVKLAITIDGKTIDIEGMVVRAWSAQTASGTGINQQFASIQFLSNQNARESMLGNKIILMEREKLAKRIR
ncbi:MAG TPA: PilZ domain-containing protein [Syntrophales bacterium]|nr:PilZ domain-containing protein [Syntrophales bacterium]